MYAMYFISLQLCVSLKYRKYQGFVYITYFRYSIIKYKIPNTNLYKEVGYSHTIFTIEIENIGSRHYN